MRNQKNYPYRSLKLFGILTLIGISTILTTGCMRKVETSVEEKIQSVQTELIEITSRRGIVEYLGTVQPEHETELSFQISGKVSSLEKKKGDYVGEGEVIATLNTEDYALQVLAAQEKLKASEYELDQVIASREYQSGELAKTKELYEAEIVSKTDYEKAELAHNQAKNTVETIAKRIEAQRLEVERLSNVSDQGVIHAPFAGVIDEVYTNNMEYIVPGMPVAKLVSEKAVLSTFVSMEDLPYFYEGKEIEIGSKASHSWGKVIFISNIAEKGSHLYEVKMEIDSKFNLNELVICRAEMEEVKGIWIPVASVQNSSVDFVYIVEDARAVKKVVQIEEIQGDRVMVKGLKKGDKLVVSGMKTLLDGMNVKESELL